MINYVMLVSRQGKCNDRKAVNKLAKPSVCYAILRQGQIGKVVSDVTTKS